MLYCSIIISTRITTVSKRLETTCALYCHAIYAHNVRHTDFFSTICFEAGTIVYYENGLALDGMTQGEFQIYFNGLESNF